LTAVLGDRSTARCDVEACTRRVGPRSADPCVAEQWRPA